MVDPLERQLDDCGWEATRRANLIYFASLPVEERVQWLADMLELVAQLREGSEAAAGDPGIRVTTVAGRFTDGEPPPRDVRKDGG